MDSDREHGQAETAFPEKLGYRYDKDIVIITYIYTYT